MIIYEVWDKDLMTDDDYIASRFLSQNMAEDEKQRRNAAHRKRFESVAQDGVMRARTEPFNWNHAYVRCAEVDERAGPSAPSGS